MFSRAKWDMLDFSPVSPSILLPKKLVTAGNIVNNSITTYKVYNNIKDGDLTFKDIVANILGATIASTIVRNPIKNTIKGINMVDKLNEQHLNIRLSEEHLIDKRRTWLPEPCKDKMTVIYHDATNKHLDVHFHKKGTSFIYNIQKKPVVKLLKFNKKGELTNKSKDLLIEHLKNEINNGSRVAQNWDHPVKCIYDTWFIGEAEDKDRLTGYGSGPTRQIVAESDVQSLWQTDDNSTTLYIPLLNKKRYLYVHKMYDSDNIKKTPIAKIGVKTDKPPKLIGNKLNLKKFKEKDIQKYIDTIDPDTNTLKYDGAATHIISSSKGTRIFSHRTSSVTGNLIEYTHKVPDIANIKGNFQGMGELCFYKDNKILEPEKISGILNSSDLTPENITARIYIYRIDRYKGCKTINKDFFKNRQIAAKIKKLSPIYYLPERISNIVVDKSIEGYVGVKPGMSLNEGGCKLKFTGANIWDWEIKEVCFKYGESSTEESPKIAGHIWCESTHTGKRYKLGAGACGNNEFVLPIMKNPNKYIGKVLRVKSLSLREGRSSSVDRTNPWHLDKGIA